MVPTEIREYFKFAFIRINWICGNIWLSTICIGSWTDPVGGTGETQLLSVETFGEATKGLDLFGDGDGGLLEGGDTEGLIGGGDDDLTIRGFPK